ncbi:hypothetical protein CHS0354_023230 [Potamilus streckersoni]|uniref:Uncharacterized protein n=1 Tax=Potamilus streckersoni TaxID=2493646 RepID=A0AAE0SJB1_9BIVA|nr:hypothetical protein CHS0354_023230 [Potamilus streckersoni]
MAVRSRDAKDVSRLVTKKLEMYMNLERRENRFDPTGPFRTTPKMHKFDFMYRVLDKVVLDQLPSERNRDGTSSSISETQSAERPASSTEERKRQTMDSSKIEEDSSNAKSNAEDKDSATKTPAYRIKPQLDQTSRSVVLHREAERLSNYANKVFEELPLQKLQLIHRHRPAYRHTIPDKPEFGKCQGYSRHVGAVLHSDKFVDYYVKEGLHVGMSKRKDLKESQKFRCNTASPREKMKRSKTDIAIPRQTCFELGLYRTKTKMSRKLPSHNKSHPSKQSLDSTTISEISSSVRSDHVPSRSKVLSPAYKRFNSSKDKQEMKEIDISLSNDLNGYQKNVAKLDMHNINGKIKSRKCVLQENERIYPTLVDDKHDQETKVSRDYNEHSIFNVNANTGPELFSGSLESSTTANILKEERNLKTRQITVSEAPKDERISNPISPKKEEDYFADKTENVRTVIYDAETKKPDFVSVTEVENNVTHKGKKEEGNEQEGEISDMNDANQNVEETTSSHHENTQKKDKTQEIIKPPKTLKDAEISQRNTAFTDKRLIKNEDSDIVTSTKVYATKQEHRETKSNSDGFAEISVTNTTEQEMTPMNRYEDEFWNSFSDAKEQQHENISFEERVIRNVDEIKEAKQETDVTIENNNRKNDEKNIEEECNYRKHSQDNMSEKIIEDENHEVELLEAEDYIHSQHCANETSNWSQTLKHEISISDTERNETVTEQHISSELREDSLSSLADPKLHSLALSNDDTDKTDLTATEVNNMPSSETEKVNVLTTVTSSVVDSSEAVSSEMSSSEDDTSEGNVSDVTGRDTEKVGNTRGGKPDENTPVEEPRTSNAENDRSLQPENEHAKPNIDNISDKPMDDIIHEPEALVYDTNDRDATVATGHQNEVESVQFKHKIPEKCEKELRLEQNYELELHSLKDSETRKSSESEDQTTEMDLAKETVIDVKVGELQDADEKSNNINDNKLERKERQEEKSEESVEETAKERSLGFESGHVSEKDVAYSETQAKIYLQYETGKPLTMEKETVKLNLESELTVSTHAETGVETNPRSIKESETRKSSETEDQTTEMDLAKETGTVVKVEELQDADEKSNIINDNELEKKERQEEKSEESVEEIAEERSLGLESENVSYTDEVYNETQAKMNLQDETEEPLRKEKETTKLNQELVLTVCTHVTADAETKPMDSTNISSIGAKKRSSTPESTIEDPDSDERQYEKSKEIKEPSESEGQEKTSVQETGEHNETEKLLDEENILATNITEDSPKVIEKEMVGDSRSDNEISECRNNDKESYTKPESLNFDHTISSPMEDTKAEGIEHSTIQDEMEKDHFKIGFQSEDLINVESSGISQIMVKETDPNNEDRSILGELQNHQAVLKNDELKISESLINDNDREESPVEQDLQDPKERHETNVAETVLIAMDATNNL